MLSANCYAPQKYIRRWSWQTFWMIQATWCWLLWPIIGAVLTIPDLGGVLAEALRTCPDRLLWSFLFSLAYGVGGTAFNISIRYIGFSLTYAIAVGLSSVLGTAHPAAGARAVGDHPRQTGLRLGAGGRRPGRAGHRLLRRRRAFEGIAICGRRLPSWASSRWPRDCCLSLLAGVLSAVYGFAIEVDRAGDRDRRAARRRALEGQRRLSDREHRRLRDRAGL